MNRDLQSTPTLSRPEDEDSNSVDHPYRWSGKIVASIIETFMGSLELRWSGGENAREALRTHGNLVVTFWHEWVLPLSYTLKSNGFCALTSRHRRWCTPRLRPALAWSGGLPRLQYPGWFARISGAGNAGPHRTVTGDFRGWSQRSTLHRQGGCRCPFKKTADTNDSPRICCRKIAAVEHLGSHDSSLARIQGSHRRR